MCLEDKDKSGTDDDSTEIFFEAEDSSLRSRETPTKTHEAPTTGQQNQEKLILDKISAADREILEMQSLITQSESQVW